MTTSQPRDIRIATACPDEIADTQWTELARLLDEAERKHCARFAIQADRRAYILAHALRRALVAGELGVAPDSLHFGEDERGAPVLEGGGSERLQFSHSRSRLGVACAVTRLAPIGIDVEPLDASRADLDLLEPYVVVEEHEPEFFRYWTMLEAFWKAAGTGLASGNPRLRFLPGAGSVEVRFEGGEDAACGMALSPGTLPGCAIAVALRMPFTGDLVMERTHCRSVAQVMQLGQAQE